MLRATVSIRLGRLPRPGPPPRAWIWQDVLHGAPPSDETRASASFTLRHGAEDDRDPDVRLAYGTIVSTQDAGAQIAVDELIAVEPRVLTDVLRVEDRVTRRVAKGSLAGLRIVRHGSSAVASAVGGRPGAAIERGTGATERAVRFAGRAIQSTLHALLHAPDRLYAGVAVSSAHLQRPRDRRALLRGFVQPHSLSGEGKAAALFLALASLVLAMLLATALVVLARPAWAEEWRAIALYFWLGIGSTIAFPFFPELRMGAVVDALGGGFAGGIIAVLTITVAMTVGAWLVLFLGDAIHGTLRAGIRQGSRVERALDWAEDFARRRGFWAAFLPLAIPLGPDTPVFYVLATVRTPPRDYLLGTFLGLLLRFSLWEFGPVLARLASA